MEDHQDEPTSTGSEPLFVQEEDGQQARAAVDEKREFNAAQSGNCHTETWLPLSAQIHPYLREMDDLLQSCEGLAGGQPGPHFSPGYTDTRPSDSTDVGRRGETGTSSQMCPSTTYIDTRVDMTEAEDELAQDYQYDAESITNSCGTGTAVGTPLKNGPLTSAGTALSNTMAEYQRQLMGMLAMLENCMEETGMDFDTQKWASDTSHEYIQISSQGSRGVRGAVETATSDQATRQSRNGRQAQTGGSESRNRSLRSAVSGQPAFRQDGIEDTLTEMGAHSGFSSATAEPRFAGSDIPTTGARREWPNAEETHVQNTRGGEGKHERDVAGMNEGDTRASAGGRPEVGMDVTHRRPSSEGLVALGSRLEEHIVEIESLQSLRGALLQELLGLRSQGEGRGELEGSTENRGERGVPEETSERKATALLAVLRREEEQRREERQREAQALRERRAEEERSVWKVNLERHSLQAEIRVLKRKLFTEARSCAHSLAILATWQHEVDLFKMEEEKLRSLVLQLTEECSELRSAQQQQLAVLQAKQVATTSQTTSTQEELAECRRHSCADIQQYMQGGLKALEERYEPMLLTLLKRRETTASALDKAREQVQHLRDQLRPLMEESHRLGLQKVCLEERLELMHTQRQEDMKQFKETVMNLEESSTELKTELKIQKRKTRETEELKDNLNKSLLLYRTVLENQEKT